MPPSPAKNITATMVRLPAAAAEVIAVAPAVPSSNASLAVTNTCTSPYSVSGAAIRASRPQAARKPGHPVTLTPAAGDSVGRETVLIEPGHR